MDLEALASLRPEDLRASLPGFLSSYVNDEQASETSRARLGTLIKHWSVDDLLSVREGLSALGAEARFYPAHPLARGLSRVWCRDIIADGQVAGVSHLAGAAERGPTVVICNHLSYLDSQAVDAVLAWSGQAALADRLVSVAGPKVYTTLFRRIASFCLNTLPVPQSTAFGYADQLSPRELARQASRSLVQANERLDEGQLLLLYAEGSRSRDRRLQPFIKGTNRYLRKEGVWVVPAALVGTQQIMPVGEPRLTPGPVRLTFGAPLSMADAGGPRAALVAAHDAVAELLPEDRKPLPLSAEDEDTL